MYTVFSVCRFDKSAKILDSKPVNSALGASILNARRIISGDIQAPQASPFPEHWQLSLDLIGIVDIMIKYSVMFRYQLIFITVPCWFAVNVRVQWKRNFAGSAVYPVLTWTYVIILLHVMTVSAIYSICVLNYLHKNIFLSGQINSV